MKLLKPMKPKTFQRWARTRQRGRKPFIWRVGVMGWGGWMFVCMTAYYSLSRANFDWHNMSFDLAPVVFNAFIWPISGYFFGWMLWQLQEAKFRLTHKN
ncbi:MAG: hypothetical protein CBB90_01560 [Gammaproteobacteria bacterium TMED30]|nr:hypothetical protein [Gammaproteobacteria bacterium]OUU06152.1 MAG: hypothetical protein CBB90_01560 [Gammaproteobacteria bacterium TMED30]